MAAGKKYVDLTGLQEFLTKLKTAYSENTASGSTFTVGQAGQADKLSAARTFTFSGDATGSGSFDGSGNVSIELTVGDDSHNHTLSHVTDLASAVSLTETSGTVTGITLGKAGVVATLADGAVATTQAFDEEHQTEDRKVATLAYVIDAINKKISATDAMLFKGVVDTTHPLPSMDYEAGWTYKVGEAGTYAGKVCEVGDMIIAVTDYTAPGAESDWAVIQTNVDGAVIGPASAVSGNIATFSGTTGKLITDGSIAASNIVLKTQRVNNKDLSSDITLDGDDIALTGYSTSGVSGDVVATDTINGAVAKVEVKADDNSSAIAILNGNDATAGSVAKAIKDTIEGLDVTTVSGDYITAVGEEDGKVTVTAGTKGSVGSGVTSLVDGGAVYTAIEAAKTETSLTITSGENGTFTYTIGSGSASTVSVLTTATDGEIDSLFNSSSS